MARVTNQQKENLKQLYRDIKDTIGRKDLLSAYGQKPIMLEVTVSEMIPSNKPKWFGKLAKLWEVKRTTVELRRVPALQRSDRDLIALLMDGSVLTARTLYRPFRRVDFKALTSDEYKQLVEHGLTWQREVADR